MSSKSLFVNWLPVFWIRIGFNADLDPAFLSQCGSGFGSDLEPGFQTNADPGGSGFGSDFWVTKDEFLHENILKVSKR